MMILDSGLLFWATLYIHDYCLYIHLQAASSRFFIYYWIMCLASRLLDVLFFLHAAAKPQVCGHSRIA